MQISNMTSNQLAVSVAQETRDPTLTLKSSGAERQAFMNYLVDHGNVCVCYLTKKDGGTAYTVDYAERQGLEIINLALYYYLRT